MMMEKGITVEKVLVTPTIAAEWLERNTNNRPLSNTMMKAYANVMQSGGWMVAAPILFDWNGNLIDGQHRLQAVIKSGRDIWFNVERGHDPAIFNVLDIGKKRTAGDILAIEGVPNHTHVAGAIKCYILLCNHNIANHANTMPSIIARTNTITLDVYRQDPELWDSAQRFAYRMRKSIPFIVPGFMTGLYVYLFKVKNNDIATIQGFFDEIAGATVSNTIILLRNRLTADLAKDRNKRMTPACKQNLIATAWNAYRRGRDLKCLAVPSSGNVDFD